MSAGECILQLKSWRDCHFSRSLADLQLAVIYDFAAQGKEDPLIGDTEKAIDYFTAVLEPGAYLVDALPFCELFHSYRDTTFDAHAF